jgi:hypothetical protein
VARQFDDSYQMFGSVLGTWIPFALIRATSYLVPARPAPVTLAVETVLDYRMLRAARMLNCMLISH